MSVTAWADFVMNANGEQWPMSNKRIEQNAKRSAVQRQVSRVCSCAGR
jgi:hypothetical protein